MSIQSEATIAKIASEMEGWERAIMPKPGFLFRKEVRKWARQLRALKPNPASPEANAVTCKQCFHYNIKEGHYTMECLSCKRYNADLFTPRADDSSHERR